MNLTLVESESPYMFIECEGQITQDATFADPFRDQFGADIYSKKVAFDLEGTSFIDSSGVSWLLKCQKRFRENEGSLTLCAVPIVVMDVLRVLSLQDTFRILERAELEKLTKEGTEE
ncbi:MAG: STAS domain-containing protein [Pirellulaceae bacterium]